MSAVGMRGGVGQAWVDGESAFMKPNGASVQPMSFENGTPSHSCGGGGGAAEVAEVAQVAIVTLGTKRAFSLALAPGYVYYVASRPLRIRTWKPWSVGRWPGLWPRCHLPSMMVL